MSIVSSNGMLVKRLSMSKLAMIQLASKLTTSSAKEKESWTVNSLTVKGDKIGTKNFAKLYVDLEKFLVPILSPLTINEFTVHDSFSFAEEVVNFDANCIMASLDVESLFTNTPLDEIIENCINDLFANNDTVYNFIKEDLKELLKFPSCESFFTFDNEYYSQLDGVAMGSPLGPTLAITFFCHFEKQWLSDCLQDFCPNIYRRYVDDIFVTFNSYEHLKKFVEYMNTKHPNIKFTFKHEHNKSFSFLDVKICWENNSLLHNNSSPYYIVALILLPLMKNFIMK